MYNDSDRQRLGTEYLGRTPAQWTAGLAVASTVGAVGASVGLHVDQSALHGRIEQKVASEVSEAVANRASLAVAPGLRRIPSKRRREQLALIGLDHEEAEAELGSEQPAGEPVLSEPRRQRSGGYYVVAGVDEDAPHRRML